MAAVEYVYPCEGMLKEHQSANHMCSGPASKQIGSDSLCVLLCVACADLLSKQSSKLTLPQPMSLDRRREMIARRS